jgi:hypothetical protein
MCRFGAGPGMDRTLANGRSWKAYCIHCGLDGSVQPAFCTSGKLNLIGIVCSSFPPEAAGRGHIHDRRFIVKSSHSPARGRRIPPTYQTQSFTS